MTKIEWTDEVFNPVTGCTKISQGCSGCYAERMSKRLAGRYGYPEAPDNFKVTLHPDKLYKPSHWKKPRLIFVCSMGDLFHEDVPFEFIDKVLYTMGTTQRHTYQILTKRPERMYRYFNGIVEGESESIQRILKLSGYQSIHRHILNFRKGIPMANLWLGVSTEDQETANERIPWLLKTPAAVRFVSAEPLLSDINFHELIACPRCGYTQHDQSIHMDHHLCTMEIPNTISQIIVGGETGPKARPMNPTWARSIRDQCRATDTKFFYKGSGNWIVAPNRMKLNFKPGDPNIHEFEDGTVMIRTMKRDQERKLDGRRWEEMPERKEML